MRLVGSTLADLRAPLGIAGTGGASGAGPTASGRPGEGDLNVRSVMEELLSRRTIALPPPGRPMMLLLARDDCEPRRIMRLVWMLPMFSGEVVWDRKAAAAAAEDRDAVDVELWRNALLAAIAADALGGPLGLGLIARQQLFIRRPMTRRAT